MNQASDLPAWVQAIGSIVAIFASVGLTILAHQLTELAARKRERDAKAARGDVVKTILSMAVDTLSDIEAKEEERRFSIGNVGSSLDDVESVLGMIATLPLAELSPVELTAVAGVRTHVLTCRRRIGFIQDHLRAGTTPKRRIRFTTLAGQAEAARAVLK